MSLKYLFDKPGINSSQARLLEFLCEFDFKIKHVKGKENKVVNALGKKFNVESISIRKSNLRKRVIDALVEDEHYIQVKSCLQ